MTEQQQKPDPQRVWYPALVNAVLTGIFVAICGGVAATLIANAIADQKSADAFSCSNPNQLSLAPSDQLRAEGLSLSYPPPPATPVYTYPPKNAFDGSLSTAWIAPADGGGVGTALTVRFAHSLDVRLICIVNGYAKGGLAAKGFEQNGSAAAISVRTDNGTRTSSLPTLDTQDPYRFIQVLPAAGPTTSATFTVQAYAPPLTPVPDNGPVSSSITEIQIWVAP